MRWAQEEISEKKKARWNARFGILRPVAVSIRQVDELHELQNDTKAWCLEHFGKSYMSHPYKYCWTINGWVAYFRHPDHAFEFKMRWC